MFSAALPEKLTGGSEVDVVAVDAHQPGGDVEDGVDVVQVKVETAGTVADYEIDQVYAEDYYLEAEEHDGSPLYL